jgi:hypothetical protein
MSSLISVNFWELRVGSCGAIAFNSTHCSLNILQSHTVLSLKLLPPLMLESSIAPETPYVPMCAKSPSLSKILTAWFGPSLILIPLMTLIDTSPKVLFIC